MHCQHGMRIIAACRQDLTWKELQPILVQSEPAQTAAQPVHPTAAKNKRKLQQPATHTQQLTTQQPAVPAINAGKPAGRDTTQPRSGDPRANLSGETAEALEAPAQAPAKVHAKKSKAVPRSHRQSMSGGDSPTDDEAVLANESTRADTPAGGRAAAGNSPWGAGQREERVLVALGGMHSHEQQACMAKLAKIGVSCISHKQCSRCLLPTVCMLADKMHAAHDQTDSRGSFGTMSVNPTQYVRS